MEVPLNYQPGPVCAELGCRFYSRAIIGISNASGVEKVHNRVTLVPVSCHSLPNSDSRELLAFISTIDTTLTTSENQKLASYEESPDDIACLLINAGFIQ